MFVLCFLMATFAYELPLVQITSRYRLNPRAFDVAAALLISYWLLIGSPRGWRANLSHPLLRPWMTLVSVYMVMAAVTVLFVPFTVFQYSVWFAFRYLLASVVLIIVLSAPLSEQQKRRLLWIGLIGGTWVSFYGVLQMLYIVPSARELPSGGFTSVAAGAITSTLGPSYFHSGQFGILSGIIGLTRAAAMALAPHGIRVNAIAPGLTDTAQPRYGSSEEEIAAMAAKLPLGRIVEPGEVADLAVFLVSDEAKQITGQTVHVNSGSYLN